MRVRRNGEWLSADMGEERVMMSIHTGNYVTLSRVGARVWELLEKPIGVDALCAKLTEEFDVTAEVCRTDVEVFLGELEAAKVIIMDPSLA